MTTDISYQQCPKCSATVPPKTRKCTCGEPFCPPLLRFFRRFVAALPPLIVVVAYICAIATNQADTIANMAIGLVASIAAGGVFYLLATWLATGSLAAWHIWNLLVVAPLGFFSFAFFMETSDTAFACIPFAVGAIYVAAWWRHADPRHWAWSSTAFVIIVFVSSAIAARTKLHGEGYFQVPTLTLLAVLTCFLYSVPIRWFCGVRMGWTGLKIHEATAGTTTDDTFDAWYAMRVAEEPAYKSFRKRDLVNEYNQWKEARKTTNPTSA